MRDLLLLCLLPVMLYAMAQRPFIAAGMWLWTAMFFPNGWVYGIAGSIRYNLLFTFVGFLSYLAYKHKPKVELGGVGALILLFFAWTTLSSVTTIGNPDVTWEYWNRFFKVIMLFLFVVLTIRDKLHIDFMLWCLVLSIGFYANLEALKYLVSGGGHKIVGLPTHVLGDRNDLALAFCMTLPFCYYLLAEYGSLSKALRFGLLCTMAFVVIAVVGTQSRGGFVALTVLGAYLYLKSDRKILLSIFIAVLVVGMSYVVSSDWSSRIDTIGEADQDQSFMTRVVAWKISFIMAMNHPFFGGGFKSLEYFPVWQEMSREFFSYPWFHTGDLLPNANYARAAHSIYFQVLSDHGFGGLALFVGCLGLSFYKARQVAVRARRIGAEPWIAHVATMLQLSIFAYAVGGAALSLAYFDLIFALFGLVVVLDKRVLPAAIAAAAAVPAQATLPLPTPPAPAPMPMPAPARPAVAPSRHPERLS